MKDEVVVYVRPDIVVDCEGGANQDSSRFLLVTFTK